MVQISNAIAIVTGGASGIGRSLCRALASSGAIVVVADRNRAGADGVAREISLAGGRARAVTLDVTDGAAVEKLVAVTVKAQGRLDIMINNAGIVTVGEVRDMEVRHWREIIDVNLMGVIHGTTAAYRVMVGQGNGTIVNVSSAAGLYGEPTAAAYTASKHAVTGLTISLRAEAAGLGVRVCLACPGYVATPIYDAAEVIRADGKALFGAIPFKMMDPDTAARKIIRGMVKNRAYTVFPFGAKLFWWISRLSPALVVKLGEGFAIGFRKLRRPDDATPTVPKKPAANASARAKSKAKPKQKQKAKQSGRSTKP